LFLWEQANRQTLTNYLVAEAAFAGASTFFAGAAGAEAAFAGASAFFAGAAAAGAEAAALAGTTASAAKEVIAAEARTIAINVFICFPIK